MADKVACKTCGVMILQRTAGDNDCKCIPCTRGTREQLETGRVQNRQRREARLAYEDTPERKFWIELVRRVSVDPDLSSLSQRERTYFLVADLYAEIYNGGFEQFFINSGGVHYAETVSALCEIGDMISAGMLRAAKQSIFGDGEMPGESMFVRLCTNALTEQKQHALDISNREMIAHAESQPDKLALYAHEHGLF